MTGTALIDAYDAALFDLDGVVYLGLVPIEGAAEGIAELRRRGVNIGFVTNNAARTPATVAEHLVELGVEASVDDVVTSSQAAARMLADQLPPGATVLVTGTAALASEVEKAGLRPVTSHEPTPDAVVQGYDPQLTQPRIDHACFAIQRGARWFATNTDATRPTDQGLVPGAGSQIAAVRMAVPVDPQVAGKPFRPLLDETVRRLGSERPIFVGDRIDTDIMGANAIGMASLFVMTGAHGVHDLADTDASGRPTTIGWDLGALLAPPRVAAITGQAATCRGQRAMVWDASIALGEVPVDREGQLDAAWAVLVLGWTSGADAHHALDTLSLLR